MIDALDARALIGGIVLQHALRVIHLRVEIQRHAQHIRGPKGAALMRQIRKRGRQVAAAEPERGAVEILLTCKFVTERANIRLA